MDVQKHPLLSIFEPKQRLEVPLFQRQYVWSEEQQWAPLWEDIERKFAETLSGRKDGPLHFLGAMVLDQKQTPTGHVGVRQVIDGQQRLTTFQIFLSAYRDFCRANGSESLANECEIFLLNSGRMANPEVDCFKVWPTQLDRAQFKDVVTARSSAEMTKRYPLVRKPYQRKSEPRPRMVEAYFYFLGRLGAFFLGEPNVTPIASESPIEDRLDECLQTLRNSLMVVVIDLQVGDDPQVIFETLNARGEPLLPADLLRNYIFLRAGHEKLNIEEVYEKHWARFDDEFWRAEIKQGRLKRARSDLFLQHFLSSRQAQDVPIKHLYVEYRHWVEQSQPFPTVLIELETLARQRDDYRRIIAPPQGDVLTGFSAFLDAYEISTVYPFLLTVLDAKIDNLELAAIVRVLESYFLRRAVCNSGTAAYNRNMLAVTRTLKDKGFTAASLRQGLLALGGESGSWPDDAAFSRAWLSQPLYETLNNARLVHIYKRLNQTFMSTFSEPLVVENKLSIEHVMPRQWADHWPLPDGSPSMTVHELIAADEDDPRLVLYRGRQGAIHTAGNLTMLTSELNSSQKNLGWAHKRPAMMAHSLLPINQVLANVAVWDETAIKARGQDLLTRALKIWPR